MAGTAIQRPAEELSGAQPGRLHQDRPLQKREYSVRIFRLDHNRHAHGIFIRGEGGRDFR